MLQLGLLVKWVKLGSDSRTALYQILKAKPLLQPLARAQKVLRIKLEFYGMTVLKVPGPENPSDVLTKSMPARGAKDVIEALKMGTLPPMVMEVIQ